MVRIGEEGLSVRSSFSFLSSVIQIPEQEYSYIRICLLTNSVTGEYENKSLRVVLDWLRNSLPLFLGKESASMVERSENLCLVPSLGNK